MPAWERVGAVLAEAKRDGVPWEAAWFKAMETLKPTRKCSTAIRESLSRERELLRETKPWWRAGYEDGEVSAEEAAAAQSAAEKRLTAELAEPIAA